MSEADSTDHFIQPSRTTNGTNEPTVRFRLLDKYTWYESGVALKVYIDRISFPL